jgi:hypothetical protein
VRLALVEPVHHPLADVVAQHPVAGIHQLDRERKSDITQPDDPEQHIAPLGFANQFICNRHVDTPTGNRCAFLASERLADSSTRTTRTPSWASARGGSSPRATRTKCCN